MLTTKIKIRAMRAFLAALGLFAAQPALCEDWVAQATRHEVTLTDFTFHTGEILPQVTMHAYTLGEPHRDADGRIDNAVMLLHGTGGDGTSLLQPGFGDQLFGPGQLLDITRYYIVSPDNLGHGHSSRPSEGLRAAFPRYDYDDMVLAEYRMLTEGLGISGLELLLGTSMGCMQSFVWGETYPGFVERLAPFACNAVEIAGRNRMFRQMIIDGFEQDPAYDNGNYADPAALERGQLVYANVLLIAGGNPYRLQAEAPTLETAQAQLAASRQRLLDRHVDPNDTIWQFDASRNYNPAPRLSEITVPVLWINSADDFINPPGLGDPEQLARTMPDARFVLIPASPETRGHGTHSAPQFWMDELARFLADNP